MLTHRGSFRNSLMASVITLTRLICYAKIRKKDEKPAYFFLSHISDLDFNSKKKTELVQIENYKKIDAFNIKKENINEIDFSDPDVLKINLSNSQVEESKSLNNIQEDESENKINSKCQTNNNMINNNKNIAQQTNKNVLSKPKKGKNIKKNNRGKKQLYWFKYKYIK